MTLNIQVLTEQLDGTENLHNCVDGDYLLFSEDADELREAIEQYIQSEEIIYYHAAISYLADNDPSLSESLELAHDMGCDTRNLTSETLATLHYQNALMEELGELDLDACFDEEEAE